MLCTVDPRLEFQNLKKTEIHRTINELVLQNYQGENYFKYVLTKEFLTRKVIAAFEVKVNESRVDFLSINGETKSFEIKSPLDNFSRLEKQLDNYSRVFEYNYVVVSHLNLTEALFRTPENYGVWVVKGLKRQEYRKAEKNPILDSRAQLSLLTKIELTKTFGTTLFENILCDFTGDRINELFKEVLKNRYNKRWCFIKDNQNEILPIDYQFFFNSNIPPSLIYS